MRPFLRSGWCFALQMIAMCVVLLLIGLRRML